MKINKKASSAANEIVITTDSVMQQTVALAYICLACVLGYLALTNIEALTEPMHSFDLSYINPRGVAAFVCIVLCTVLCIGALITLYQSLQTHVLMTATERELVDTTHKGDIQRATWDQVIAVQLKSANNNSLMLDVVIEKSSDERDSVANMGYMLFEVSGLWIRRRRMQQAFKDLSTFAVSMNPDVMILDDSDPLRTAAHKHHMKKTSDKHHKLF